MKTEDLISALAADTVPEPRVARQLGFALLLALSVSTIAFAVFWGPRPDLWDALGSFAVFKTIGALGMVLLAASIAIELTHPGMDAKRSYLVLGVVLACLGAWFATELARQGLSGLGQALSTPSLFVCLLSIPVLALPLFVAVFRALASGAALQPRLAGASGGLVAGALAASLYSLYCDKDMVLFVLPAYATAIGGVTVAGALLGPRLLRW